ncbi:high-affinity branched-chain amino acid ABC transporter permease LivM [uncultured Bartonella sp.]|uniref:high-affinity branched-chain amino acid ABC transporter permease LivM n=1 Tax=uncultured Bartonella sp. TaxID=104108 RepID=UPI00262CED3A|nr:high-affinity branched-chain amino acid ABC transporter permease LivM [uncultured Bartonella sp.]
MNQIPSFPNPGKVDIAHALGEGAKTALIAFLLFVFIVGFRADLNLRNEMTLTPQIGYLLNYIVIAGVGRFTWCLFGGGKKGAIFALVPSVILFIAYRAWLYYADASAQSTYVFSAQARQLLIAGGVIAAFLLLAIIFLYAKGLQQSIRITVREVGPSVQKYAPGFILALLLVYPFLVTTFFVDTLNQSQKWIDNYAIQILIYVMLAWGLNIVVGLAGLLDLGYVAFYAVGAYTVALLGNHFGFSFWLCLPLAGIFAALWGMMLGFPVLRLRGDYLAIVTLAFGEIIRTILQNWTPVTGGAAGLSVKKATFFGIPFTKGEGGFAETFGLQFQAAHYKIFLYYVILVMVVITAWVVVRLRRLPIGRAWEALREDEIACRSLGINTVTTKLTAFSIGAMFGGFAGAFFAARQGRADYTSFIFDESAIILAIVVLGGMGSLGGIAIAAVVMIGGMELLRDVPTLQMIFGPDFDPAQYRMLWFGLAMVFVMVWKPRGFVGKRQPSAFLKVRKAVSGDFTKEGNG